jgi:hypothetical protein
MKINTISEEMKNQIKESIENAPAEQKSDAILEAMEKIASVQHEDLVKELIEQSRQVAGDAERAAKLGIVTNFSEEEKKFLNTLKGGAKQAVTFTQADVIPTTIVDRTLADVKTESDVAALINFAPAGVHKWLTGSKSGSAVWGALDAALTGSEISATISGMNLEVYKLYAYCVIPKSLRDLEIGYVEKYVRAVLAEALLDGIEAGYINGDGKVAPIGIMRQINTSNADGTKKAKTALATVKGFGPKGIAPALKVLTKNGTRKVKELALVCNPLDEVDYVNPALYGDTVAGGFTQKCVLPLTVASSVNCPQGSAILTIPGKYTMGFSGLKVDEYKETKAIEDADLFIAKVEANGRADDDESAVVFDVTKLEEYVIPVKTAAAASSN